MPDQPVRPTLTLSHLREWEDAGAQWRTLEISDELAVVELCTCFGEPVDVLAGASSDLIAFVRAAQRREA